MGLTTAPAMAFAVDYLVHDAFNISDHSIVVTVAGFGSVSAASAASPDPMAQAKLDHGQLPPELREFKTSEAITRVAPFRCRTRFMQWGEVDGSDTRRPGPLKQLGCRASGRNVHVVGSDRSLKGELPSLCIRRVVCCLCSPG